MSNSVDHIMGEARIIMENIKRYKKIYIVLQLLVVICASVLFNAIQWSNIQSRKRFVFSIFVLGSIVVSPFFLMQIKKNIYFWIEIKQKLLSFWNENKKKSIFFLIGGLSGSICISLLISKILKCSGYKTKFWIALFVLVFGIYIYREFLINRIHILFFCSMLLVGSLYVCEFPPIVGISWDDEIHYARALKVASIFDGVNYEADHKIISEYLDNMGTHNCYDVLSRETYLNEVEKVYRQKKNTETELGTWGIFSISYVPSAVGILIARGLNLNFRHMFMLGKFLNLLMYILITTLAIRKIPYGKILMTVIGMIPTMTFMASSYSYDPWVMSWILLGYAYFVDVICANKANKEKELIIAAVCITIGCLPKAIYFALLFPLMLVGEKSVQNDKKRKICKIVVGICIIVLVASFLLPMLIHGAGSGDARGGADVNSTEQIKFILYHPMQYFQIWFEFIKNYISINTSHDLVLFAYAGFGQYYGVAMATILVVAVLDRIRICERKISLKITVAGTLLLIMLLVPTALYISFTAVGSSTIEGCQPRYILPVLFPAFIFLPSDNIQNNINIKLFRMVPICIMLFVLLNSLYFNMVSIL